MPALIFSNSSARKRKQKLQKSIRKENEGRIIKTKLCGFLRTKGTREKDGTQEVYTKFLRYY